MKKNYSFRKVTFRGKRKYISGLIGFLFLISFFNVSAQTGSSCSTPHVIPGYPFAATNVSMANAGSHIDGSCLLDSLFTDQIDSCSGYLNQDYVFSFTSNSNGFYNLDISFSHPYYGIFVTDNCPESNSNCLFEAIDTSTTTGQISGAFFIPAGETIFIKLTARYLVGCDSTVLCDSVIVGNDTIWLCDTATLGFNIYFDGPPPLEGFIQSSNCTCSELCDGSAIAWPSGGQPPYTFLWNTGEATPEILNLCAGPYTVTIIDAMGQTVWLSQTITEPLPLQATYVVTDCSSPDSADGAIALYATGGVYPYSYLWSNEATVSSPGNLVEGLYRVTITDNSYCTYVSPEIQVKASNTNVDIQFTDQIDIFPNPSNGVFYISTVGQSTIEIFSIIGERIYYLKDAENINVIDLRKFSQGQYIVRITNNRQIFTKQISLIVNE
ncbi:MAG: hypothetical protein A2275_14155 [Bacteroidetes bacterium RIFOXYA12_FULL_35_11]|nr:MAG: hypothetical protein A2X01_15910 [Bacteroidetes bacterium GWF2_35_48]OFY83509.1 MAG: hypothetical protein A2275_14155 [Bacteroidetes bacterium RIFOXYA12_FULL_35_11]OFZ02361.1 MAG: hypothetical protein A2491_11185 [Bacteroidetes bacterium RIFOXYC12_FULL_35_7]HBX50814.1 hypothetical protein [Bacteroidales bacterium]